VPHLTPSDPAALVLSLVATTCILLNRLLLPGARFQVDLGRMQRQADPTRTCWTNSSPTCRRGGCCRPTICCARPTSWQHWNPLRHPSAGNGGAPNGRPAPHGVVAASRRSRLAS
jgi:hypothetical protein